jgi:hypothetical protein
MIHGSAKKERCAGRMKDARRRNFIEAQLIIPSRAFAISLCKLFVYNSLRHSGQQPHAARASVRRGEVGKFSSGKKFGHELRRPHIVKLRTPVGEEKIVQINGVTQRQIRQTSSAAPAPVLLQYAVGRRLS